jgi:hypothetical protein
MALKRCEPMLDRHSSRLKHAMPSRRVAGGCVEALGVGPSRASTGADLGGSSKYSNENFEGRSGEGFHVNSI